MMGIADMTVSGTTTATIAGQKWQICVLVTDPTAEHTLNVEVGAKIDVDNCMVQDNTANSYAVESRGGGDTHSQNGVTFLLTGQNAGVNISTGGTFTRTPASNGDAGVFDGFIYYLNPAVDAKGKPTYAQSSVFSGTKVNANGIIYLVGQEFVVDSG